MVCRRNVNPFRELEQFDEIRKKLYSFGKQKQKAQNFTAVTQKLKAAFPIKSSAYIKLPNDRRRLPRIFYRIPHFSRYSFYQIRLLPALMQFVAG